MAKFLLDLNKRDLSTIAALFISYGPLKYHLTKIEKEEYIVCYCVAIAHYRQRHLEEGYLDSAFVRIIATKSFPNFFKTLEINRN